MTIQKKSLLNKMSAKKEAPANTTSQDNPSVSAPVAARHLSRYAAVHGRRVARRKK